jgi:asparagine synthase (glutamine-hydrolysing)
MGDLDPHLVEIGCWSDLPAELGQRTWHVDEPFDGAMMLIRALDVAAADTEVRVLLDGIDADNLLSYGSYLRCLLRQGRWATAGREARGVAEFWDDQAYGRKLLQSSFRQAYLPAPALRALAHVRGRVGRHRVDVPLSTSIIDRDFARRVDALGRLRELDGQRRGNGWDGLGPERARSLGHPFLAVGLERYDRVAAAAGVEPRHPYLDRRLIDFCLRLPGEQKLRGGWPKAILRRSMAGRLPDAIRWRKGRDHLGWAVTKSLVGSPTRLREIIDANRALISGVVDLERLPLGEPDDDGFEQLLVAAQLAVWLADHHYRRPAHC